MAAQPAPRALLQFVDDEMLRAPLLFDQLVEGTLDHGRKSLPELMPLQRSVLADLLHALLAHRSRLADYFSRSLREQVDVVLNSRSPRAPGRAAAKADKPLTLALVDDDVVALDVELSHTIEAIKSVAEYELRELQTFIAAMVGDMDVAADHNPFRPEVYARALWAAAQALPLSRGHQVAFMRQAGAPLAQLLRKTYAASTSRLEALGVEPAAYRTLILPAGSRRGSREPESNFVPDLHRMVETMPAPLDGPQRPGDRAPAGEPRERWIEVARHTDNRADRQVIELVSRLFEAMLADARLPADVSLLISRLQGPAMRLTLRDDSMLDQEKHPLWRFINRLAYEAEMAPDPLDPERVQLLKVAQAAVDQLASEPEQNTGLYRWAFERLESFLLKRFTRRVAAAASQIGALQKLEDTLMAGRTEPSSLHGMLDVQGLDTVPASLLDEASLAATAPTAAQAWLDSLRPGLWVRMFLQGRWVQARLLWPGERREIWLFGDGGSDATWAVRRSALLMMHSERLAKTLVQRSVVGTAASRVQQQVGAAAAG
ncbi:MAG: DUF1631 family protein [Rubrivivax sp.]|nr:DUF1631 family protein [Rubrivivax sp.]